MSQEVLSEVFIPSHLKYFILDSEFKILDYSENLEKFSETPQEFGIGKDARLSFPELIGLEKILEEILQGDRNQFKFQGIARPIDGDNLIYFDLIFEKIGDRAIVLLEDVTEMMNLNQSLFQRVNETELLIAALTAAKDYNKKILSAMGNVLFVTTRLGKIKTINQAVQGIFKYSEEELIGLPISEIIKNREEALASDRQKLLDGESVEDIEVKCTTKEGCHLIVEFSCSVIQTEKKVPAFIYIGRDITERKRAEAEIEKALKQEKELNDLKSRFISMTSHEFRNPLSSILMSIELLENYSNRWPEEKKQKHLKRIKQSTDNMTRLLEDVLTIGRADVGKLEVKPIKLNLAEFCRELVEEFQLTAGEKYQIQLQCSDDLDSIHMDEKLLRHIFTNLLSNAIKYSPDGGIIDFTAIRVSPIKKDEEIEEQIERIKFTVRDRGLGIPPEDRSRLFEHFHRAKNVKDISGTGLGLSIVKKAVDLYDGVITFTSEVGVGTTFHVILPIIDN
ncbi:MAG: PAS domain S-box protein [Cyanobacteria bacterium SBLK]|nr:PAS domain S-box protein [Cyanobacteria bacterium SBLK]